MSEEIRINFEKLEQFCTNIFIKVGVSKKDAFISP